MLDVALLVLQMALGIAFPALIVRFDERRLAPRLLERTWQPASFWSAVVVFGPLCLPVHFTKTRRNLGGFLLGLLALALAVVAQGLVGAALESLFGE